MEQSINTSRGCSTCTAGFFNLTTTINGFSFSSLSSAINLANNGDTVLLGNHTISSTLTINKSITLKGGTLTLNGAGLKAAANNVILDEVNIVGSGTSLLFANADSNFTGWLFRDCTFNGVSLRLTKLGRTQIDGSIASTGSGVTDNSIIDGCTLTGYLENYTIEVGGCENVTIQNCHIHNTGLDVDAGDGIKVLAGSTNILIDNCLIEYCTRDAIDVFDASFTITRDSSLLNCNLGYDAKNELSANSTDDHEIIRCTVEDNVSGGINGDSDRIIVEDCTILNNGNYGIRFNGDSSVARNNYIRGHIHDIRLGLNTTNEILEDNDYETFADASG